MMNHYQLPDQSLADSFDQDYSQQDLMEVSHLDHSVTGNEWISPDYSGHGHVNYLDYQDPLKHVHKINFEPCTIDVGNTHFVHPHAVKGYFRQDGTFVEGYYRDGDGDTGLNRTVEAGGGYVQTNPDGILSNNLSNR